MRFLGYRTTILVIAVLAIAVGCTNPPKKSESTGGDSDQPVPGDPIILKPTGPEVGGQPTYQWYQNGETANDRLTCETWHITNKESGHYCELRNDFIGDMIHTFTFTKESGGTITAPTNVMLTGANYRIQIRNIGRRFIWSIYKKDGQSWDEICPNVIPDPTFDPDTLPAEFCDTYKKTDLKETTTNDVGKRLDLRVNFLE